MKYFLSVFMTLCLSVLSVQVQAEGLVVKDVYGFETAGAATSGGFFMTIENTREEADRLVKAALPATVADRVELHTHIAEDDGIMRMRQVEAVDIPANGIVEFRPMSYHLMVFGLKQPLQAGQVYPLTLHFEKMGAVETQAVVKALGGQSAHHGHKH